MPSIHPGNYNIVIISSSFIFYCHRKVADENDRTNLTDNDDFDDDDDDSDTAQ